MELYVCLRNTNVSKQGNFTKMTNSLKSPFSGLLGEVELNTVTLRVLNSSKSHLLNIPATCLISIVDMITRVT